MSSTKYTIESTVELPVQGDEPFNITVASTAKSFIITYPKSCEVSPAEIEATLALLTSINGCKIQHVMAQVLTRYTALKGPLPTAEWQDMVRLQLWANRISAAFLASA